MDDGELERVAAAISNWGRWGDHDERGTLNHLRPEHTARAAALVRTGRTVSLARQIPLERTRNSSHVVWRLFTPLEAASEFVGIDFHGPNVTHVDALNHIHRDGRMYNGFEAAEIQPRTGSVHLTVETMREGVIGRGVLLDVARARGRALDPGEGAVVADLEAAAALGGVEVGEADLVFVRTGANPDETEHGAPGMAPECVPWFAERRIALLGADVANDPAPFREGAWPLPVHQLSLYHLGMPLVDNCDLEPLSEACAEAGRWEFLLTIAPLRVKGGSGSPVNPIAVF
jgi:kynurenine formamidase